MLHRFQLVYFIRWDACNLGFKTCSAVKLRSWSTCFDEKQRPPAPHWQRDILPQYGQEGLATLVASGVHTHWHTRSILRGKWNFFTDHQRLIFTRVQNFCFQGFPIYVWYGGMGGGGGGVCQGQKYWRSMSVNPLEASVPYFHVILWKRHECVWSILYGTLPTSLRLHAVSVCVR